MTARGALARRAAFAAIAADATAVALTGEGSRAAIAARTFAPDATVSFLFSEATDPVLAGVVADVLGVPRAGRFLRGADAALSFLVLSALSFPGDPETAGLAASVYGKTELDTFSVRVHVRFGGGSVAVGRDARALRFRRSRNGRKSLAVGLPWR